MLSKGTRRLNVRSCAPPPHGLGWLKFSYGFIAWGLCECANDIKIALFTVLKIIETYRHYRVHNIFLAFRYEYMRKNPAIAPTTIPPVVAQNAHCSKTNLLSTQRWGRHVIYLYWPWIVMIHGTEPEKKVKSARLYRICFEIWCKIHAKYSYKQSTRH